MKLKVFASIISMVLLCSCASYYVTPETLMAHNGPFSSITTLKCRDKDGNDYILDITRNTEMHIVLDDGTRESFLFFTGYLHNGVITGNASTIINLPINPVKLEDIKTIRLTNN